MSTASPSRSAGKDKRAKPAYSHHQGVLMFHRVSRSFFAGGALRGIVLIFGMASLPAAIVAPPPGLPLPVTPCTIIAKPILFGDPQIQFSGAFSGWSRAQMAHTLVVFYALPSRARVSRVLLDGATIRTHFEVPEGTNAVGLAVYYNNALVPTTPPTPGQLGVFRVGRTTAQHWQLSLTRMR